MACYNCPFGGPAAPVTQRGINDVKPSFIGGGRSSNRLTTPAMPSPSKAAKGNRSFSLKKW